MTYQELEDQVNQNAEDIASLQEAVNEADLVGGIGGLSFTLDQNVQQIIDQEILSFVQGRTSASLTPDLNQALDAITLSYIQTSTDAQNALNSNTLSYLQGRTGTATLSAGLVTIQNPLVTNSSIIIVSRKTVGGTLGHLYISAQSNGSFTITSSSNTDTSTVNYLII
jgi:hypothetical protein